MVSKSTNFKECNHISTTTIVFTSLQNLCHHVYFSYSKTMLHDKISYFLAKLCLIKVYQHEHKDILPKNHSNSLGPLIWKASFISI